MSLPIPIKIYYHVTQINDYLEITEYLFDKIVESGLMERCESISIGALGDKDKLEELKELIKKYPKAQIRAYDEEKLIFEFHTIRMLRNDADEHPLFYALYFHSKSVTFSKQGNRADWEYEIFWRDYMTWATITRWKDNYQALDMPDKGYDIAGARAIVARDSASARTHFSGNFWWARSDYLKTLRSIRGIDNGSRFEPEMWVFSGMPLAYISCNAFTVGFPHEKTFEETIKEYPIQQYCTRP